LKTNHLATLRTGPVKQKGFELALSFEKPIPILLSSGAAKVWHHFLCAVSTSGKTILQILRGNKTLALHWLKNQVYQQDVGTGLPVGERGEGHFLRLCRQSSGKSS
jgi:hypothetical protein